MDRPLRLLLLSFALSVSGVALADGAGHGYADGVSLVVLQRGTSTADGAPIAYPRTDRPEVTAALVTIAPGAETGWHKHPIPLYAYVQQGTLEVHLEDGGASTYRGGDVIFEVVDTWHNGRNTGDSDAKLIVFYLGIEGEPTTVKRAP